MYLSISFDELHVYKLLPYSDYFSDLDYFSLSFWWENGHLRDSVFALILHAQLRYCKG